MASTDDPLVSTEWLAAHLKDANVKVVDASFKMPGVMPLPRDDYLNAHIPGAVFFDVDAVADRSNPLPHMFPSPEQFGHDVGALCIGNDDTVVIYDAGGWVAGPRAWWMFLAYGHHRVRVLDGGLKKWRAEGRQTESGPVTPKPAAYRASFEARRVRNMEQMVDNLASKAEHFTDGGSDLGGMVALERILSHVEVSELLCTRALARRRVALRAVLLEYRPGPLVGLLFGCEGASP